MPGAHVRVVTGFDPHPNLDKAGVHINDPWEVGMTTFRLPNRGAQYAISYSKLVRQEETLAGQELSDPAYTAKPPVYVAHLASRPHSD